MADTVEYFNALKPRVENGEFASATGSVFQFEIEGAGIWVIDLKDSNTVTEGDHGSPDCTIQANKETFDSILDNPSSAMTYFMSGALRADNLGLAMQLQSFIG
jgi:putative sterol carrier protein